MQYGRSSALKHVAVPQVQSTPRLDAPEFGEDPSVFEQTLGVDRQVEVDSSQ